MVVNCLVWMLGIELGSFPGAASAFNHSPACLFLVMCIYASLCPVVYVSASSSQRPVWDPLGLLLQVVVTHTLSVGTGNCAQVLSLRVTVLLSAELSSRLLVECFDAIIQDNF